MLRTALIAMTVALPMPASAAPYLFIESDDDAGRNAIPYTGCEDPEIWHECVYITLGCDDDGGG